MQLGVPLANKSRLAAAIAHSLSSVPSSVVLGSCSRQLCSAHLARKQLLAQTIASPAPTRRRFLSTTTPRRHLREDGREQTRDHRQEHTRQSQDHERGTDNMASKDKPKASVQLKVPKGTRDWSGAEMLLRDEIFETITKVFKRHGGEHLDTPVFELKEVLAGKYGEDSRLIYDLADQGGELCALRYDLTVPFARWLAMTKTQQIKRYQIAKVYRRDQPAIARGRMREFYQCDFDIAGVYDRMIPDAEILRVVYEIFTTLEEDITIKLNHRQILDGIFAVAGVPAEKIRTISSAVDKLDKAPWEDVKKEMVEEKGLLEPVADIIGEYVKNAGDIPSIIKFIKGDAALYANANIKQGVDDMELLTSFLDAFGVPSAKVSFDLSLCRGLDYYTGLIFEIIVKIPDDNDKKSKKKKGVEEPQVGSIAAGGRYDNLVGMYGKTQIPCVGVSFGVDRIFTIMKAKRDREAKEAGRTNAGRVRQTDVYIMAFGGGSFNGLLKERMAVARQLWDAGIRTEFQAKTKPRLPQQFKAAEHVPLGVILGEDELAKGQVRLKVLNTGKSESDEKDQGQLVAQDELVEAVKKLLI